MHPLVSSSLCVVCINHPQCPLLYNPFQCVLWYHPVLTIHCILCCINHSLCPLASTSLYVVCINNPQHPLLYQPFIVPFGIKQSICCLHKQSTAFFVVSTIHCAIWHQAVSVCLHKPSTASFVVSSINCVLASTRQSLVLFA